MYQDRNRMLPSEIGARTSKFAMLAVVSQLFGIGAASAAENCVGEYGSLATAFVNKDEFPVPCSQIGILFTLGLDSDFDPLIWSKDYQLVEVEGIESYGQLRKLFRPFFVEGSDDYNRSENQLKKDALFILGISLAAANPLEGIPEDKMFGYIGFVTSKYAQIADPGPAKDSIERFSSGALASAGLADLSEATCFVALDWPEIDLGAIKNSDFFKQCVKRFK